MEEGSLLKSTKGDTNDFIAAVSLLKLQFGLLIQLSFGPSSAFQRKALQKCMYMVYPTLLRSSMYYIFRMSVG